MCGHYQLLLLICLIAIFHAAYADHSHNKTNEHSHSHNETHSHGHSHNETHGHSHNKTNEHSHSHNETHGHGHSHNETHGHSHNKTDSHNHSHSDHHGSARTLNETALQEKCNKTRYPASCLAVARSDAHKYPNIDYKAMLHMMVAAATKSAHQAAKESSLAAAKTGIPDSLVKNLKECPKSFKDALDTLKAAKIAIAKGEGPTGAINLTAALNNAGQCHGTFQERPTAQANPMQNDTESVKEIISNALTFTYLTFNITQPNQP